MGDEIADVVVAHRHAQVLEPCQAQQSARLLGRLLLAFFAVLFNRCLSLVVFVVGQTVVVERTDI